MKYKSVPSYSSSLHISCIEEGIPLSRLIQRSLESGGEVESTSPLMYDTDLDDDDFTVDPMTDVRLDRFSYAESLQGVHETTIRNEMTRIANSVDSESEKGTIISGSDQPLTSPPDSNQESDN